MEGDNGNKSQQFWSLYFQALSNPYFWPLAIAASSISKWELGQAWSKFTLGD